MYNHFSPTIIMYIFTSVIDRIELCINQWIATSLEGVIHNPMNYSQPMAGQICVIDIRPKCEEALVVLQTQHLDDTSVIYSCDNELIITSTMNTSMPSGSCHNVSMDDWMKYSNFVKIMYTYSHAPLVIVYEGKYYNSFI